MELELIKNKIFEIRGMRVILDLHLAQLYGVQTRVLKQAVKRNIERFPGDFMFELTRKETQDVIEYGVSQNVIPHGYNTGATVFMAFTEQGVAMISSILRSNTAIEVNIAIMRTFVALRQYSLEFSELNRKLERFMVETNMQFLDIYTALTELATTKDSNEISRNPIGFKTNKKD